MAMFFQKCSGYELQSDFNLFLKDNWKRNAWNGHD